MKTLAELDLLPVSLPTGPRSPTYVPAPSVEMLAQLANSNAQLIRGAASLMAMGMRARDAFRSTARSMWTMSEASPPEHPVPADVFRWLAELGETPDTPEGIAHLLRVAQLTEVQSL